MSYIKREDAYDIATLTDWLITSVVDDEPPVWMDEHIDELMRDFLIFPKNIPAADVRPVVRGRWELTGRIVGAAECACSRCGYISYGNAMKPDGSIEMKNFCPNCGAMMDGEG